MAPPKPKPKPRTELARAAAVASKWAFGTPGLSDKQQAAARRNYDYIQTRLRETGGGTTTAEEKLGRQWQAKREARPVTIPKPRGAKTYRPGDPEYSSDAVLSSAEVQRSAKAIRSPKTVLKELERQGFQKPETEQQARAQVKQLVKRLQTTERSSIQAALKNPYDVAGNADLLGPKTARMIAQEAKKAEPPKPTTGGWGKATAKGIDWLVPERAERALGGAEAATMGITPDFIEAPYRNLKSVTADMAMAFPAIGETIFNDVTGKTHWAVPKMAKEMLVAWGQGIEAATPLPADLRKTLSDVAHGRWDELGADAKKDFQKMAEEWTQRPFTALLNVYPAVSGAARVAEFPTLVRRIAAANPQMSRAAVIRAARKESYVPGYGAARLADPRGGKGIRAGYEGGIPKRILKGKLVDDAGETLSEFKAGARPPSRGALGRGIQGKYDKWSRGDYPLRPENMKGLGRFSELRRASRALQKHNTMEFERSRVGLLQQMAPLESYIRQSGLSNRVKNLSLERIAENRARLSETFYGPSGPPGNVVETLTAVSTDLAKLAREGGLDIPTNTLAKINKEIQRVDLKLERYGQTVHTNTGRWAEAQDAMREAGYTQEQIEVNLELASTVARAWAKRKAGRDPSDWIDSPEGRDLVGIEFGTPDAAALKQSLFQVLYPEDADIPEWAGNPYRLNRAAAEAGEEAPVPPPFSTGPATSAKGRPLATHTTRHTEAGQDIRATVDVDGNPLPGADPELLAKVEKQLPQEGRLETTVDGDEVWVGRTTLKQKSDRMLRFFNSLDGDQQELFRRWYERTWDYIAHIYGEETAQQMGNAFYASQAAQSPAGGIAMLFRIAQEISEGKKLSKNAGFIQKNVWKLMEGEHLGENPKGLAAKLMDFFDSGAGMNMRSLLEGMSEGGPGVVDRWTWRSDGFITPEKGGKAPDMMRARIPGIEADGQLKSTTGKTYGYEYSSMRLQELTTRWNRAGVGGRRDWTIDQIQAIDWFATKQDWVAKKFTPTSAEGGSPLDMALENTREVSFAGTPEQLRAAVEEAGAGVEILRGVRGEERALTDVSEGPEGGVHAIVIGAPKVMNKLEETLGKLGPTYSMRYPGQFGGTATQRRHHIDVPRSRKGAASDAVSGWKKKDKPLAVELGEDTVRLDFGTGKTGAARAKEFAGTMGIPEGEITARFSVARGGKPTVLTQRVATGVAGAVQWLDTEGGRQILYLSEHANPSTFAHELFGHASHEMKREFPDEFAKVEQRVGKPLEQWTRDDHEAFATSMERYLMTGKAPTPELQPVFTQMKRWMKTVYETIKALGKHKINPETERLFDRYFGKEPLDFTPPKRLRRTLPQPGDIGAVSKLIDETADILMRGPAVLSNDPASRMRVAGNMKWLEQQVLPFVGEMDSRVAERVHDLFRQFDDVKSGESIFSPDERRLLEARGKLLSKRHGELNKMARSLRAQPDAVFLDRARGVMDDLDNAESLEDIADSIKDLKGVAREADKRTTGDFERQRWLERQVKDLERALKSDRPIDKAARDEAIGALRMISEHMTDIYLDIFGEGLSPEARAMLKRSLEVRDNIIPERLRKLGLLKEGTGSGVYMPHYSVFDKVFSQIRGPVRLPAAGGKRKQLSMKPKKEGFTTKQNRLIRYQTGELLVDPRTLLSAYKQRLRFLETSMLRKQLYDIGVKIPEDPVTGNPRIPEGWYILNGSGKAIPKRLERMAEMSQSEIDDLIASGQDFDSMLSTESGTMEMLQEYRDSWLSKGEIPPEWQSDKLRMVPPEVVETMVGKVFESAPGGAPQAMLGLLSVGGRVATIFSHPIGYIHANVAANAMLLALTNPSRLGRAAMEAMPVIKFLKVPGSLRAHHPALYQMIATLTGDIKAEAGIPNFYVKAQTGLERAERTVTEGARNYAGFLGDIADQPFRVASWTGHARKYGFTDPEGWRLLATSDEPEIKAVREIVSQRARDDMLDFNKLTAQEQRMARYLFIWPFIRAAVAQPAWLVREYPARMAAMALAAQGQEEAYKDEGMESVRSRYNAVAPAEERSMFDINDVPVAGGTINMNPINPVGPFSEKMSEAYRISHGDFTPVGDVWNPGYTELIKGIFGDRGMDWARVLDSTLPGATFFHAATKPKSRGAQKYTDRDSYWDYIRRREGRFWPEDVDPEKVREAGKKEKEKLDKRPAWEKAHEEDMADYDKIVAAATAQGKRPPNEQEEAAIKRSIAAYNALDQAEDGMKETTGKVELDERDKIQATYEVVKMYYPEKVGSLPPLEEVLTWPEKKTEGVNDIPSLREDIRAKIRGKRSKLMSRGRDLGLDVE